MEQGKSTDMVAEVREYIEKYPDGIRAMYADLRALIMESAPAGVEEVLWAKLPSYYLKERFVRLIPFKDHINIEAAGLLEYAGQLSAHRFTPRGMLQLYTGGAIPADMLKMAFKATFSA